MKISIIMQAYLGEYPGSRKDSDKKFIRAVQSFIDQTDKDSELIIVSDGCNIVHTIYYELYKTNERIKYIYVDKDTPNMYEGDNDQPYYRGIPRQVGRSLASGNIISYMDSDDYLMPYAIQIIKLNWKSSLLDRSDYKWAMTSRWIDNQRAIEFWKPSKATTTFGNPFRIKGLDDMWVECGMTDPGLVTSGTFSISHIRDLDVQWTDKVGQPSEDTVFAKKMYKSGKGFIIQSPYYVRCHYGSRWDY